MEYQIRLKKRWRWMPKLQPGLLNVPRDIDDRNAARAIADGVAVKEAPFEVAQRTFRKGKFDNKAIFGAAEDRSALE